MEHENAGRAVGRRAFIASVAVAAGGAMAVAPAHAASPKRYKIVYKLAGGANPKGQVKYVRKGAKVAAGKLKAPSREGYAFAGWYSDKARTSRLRRIRGVKGKAARTAYAKWEAVRYAVRLEPNGGALDPAQETGYTVKRGVRLFDPAREGCSFGGWYGDPGFAASTRCREIPAGSTGDRTFYAKWDVIRYAISFGLDGGELDPDQETGYTVEGGAALLDPRKEGWYFGGWYEDEGLSTRCAGIPAGSTGDKTVYARWNALPGYWEEHLEPRVARINAIAESMAGGGFTFAFVTDLHFPGNAGFGGRLVQALRDRAGVSRVVCGGDLLDRRSGREAALSDIACWTGQVASLEGVEHYPVRGNHDSNDEIYQPDPADTVSDEDLRSAAFGSLIGADELASRGAYPLYYHVDFPDERVRMVVLDTGHPCSVAIDSPQLGWMRGRLLELEEGWRAIVACHRFYNFFPADDRSDLTLDSCGRLVKAALDDVCVEMRAGLVGVVCGHSHRDFASRSQGGYTAFSVTCDAYSGAALYDCNFQHRELGTTTEHALDVVQVDFARRKVYTTRIGAGADREFDY